MTDDDISLFGKASTCCAALHFQTVTAPIRLLMVLCCFLTLQAKPSFFCKLLEVMTNDDISLCLSPQGFSNVDPATDIFNNTNQQFWE